jgi:amino acid transporter
MAYIAGIYAAKIYPFPYAQTVYALSSVIVLTWINSLGVREGKWTQNLLTTAKVLGLGGVILAALFVSPPETTSTTPGVELQMVHFSCADLCPVFLRRVERLRVCRSGN